MNKSEKSKDKGMTIKQRMYAGEKSLTIQSLSSDNEYAQAWAIGACIKNQYTDDEISRLLEALENSRGRPMGIPVRALASAALHELGLKEYTGNDETVLGIIKTHFSFAL